MIGDKACRHLVCRNLRPVQHGAQEGNIGGQAGDGEFLQRAPGAGDRAIETIGRGHDELGQQRVETGDRAVTALGKTIHTHARTARRRKTLDQPGARAGQATGIHLLHIDT